MVDFSNVSSKKVSAETTAVYDLFDIMEGASLIVAPATRSNKAYNSALMRRMIPQQRRISGGKMTPEFIDKYREDLKELYADHVIRNWNGVIDKERNEVSFSREAVRALLDAFPTSSWDALIEFCENEGNFREDAEGLAKN